MHDSLDYATRIINLVAFEVKKKKKHNGIYVNISWRYFWSSMVLNLFCVLYLTGFHQKVFCIKKIKK